MVFFWLVVPQILKALSHLRDEVYHRHKVFFLLDRSVSVYDYGYVPRHLLLLVDCYLNRLLHLVTKRKQVMVLFHCCDVLKTFSPCVDCRNRVAHSFLSHLPLEKMSWDRAMISFKERFTPNAYQLVVHQISTAETVGDYLCKYISVVVLDCDYGSSLPDEKLTNHVVNVAMFVIDELVRKVFCVFVVHFCENVPKTGIVLSEEGLLCSQF